LFCLEQNGDSPVKAHVIIGLAAIGAFAITLFIGWYDGVDYLIRGRDQAFWTMEGLLAALAVYLFMRTKLPRAATVFGSRRARILTTVVAFVIVFVEAWYGGLNPFMRGHGQGEILFTACVAAFLCWACPLWARPESRRCTESP
jgi:hypothetical protein